MVSGITERIIELEESELFDDVEEVTAESVTSPPAPILANAIPIPARRSAAPVEVVRAEEASSSSDSDDDGILLDSDEELSARWARDNETYSVPSNSGGNLTSTLGADSSAPSYSPALSLLDSGPVPSSTTVRGVGPPQSPFFAPASVPNTNQGATRPRGLVRHVSNISERALRSETSEERVQMTLGTSMPISIPMLPRTGSGAVGSRGAGPRFVPPHLLTGDVAAGEQRDLVEMLSSSRLTPAASYRRDRLTARNAIMRATGFLEQTTGGMGPVAPEEFASLASAPPGLFEDGPEEASYAAALPTRGFTEPIHRPTSSLTALLGTPS